MSSLPEGRKITTRRFCFKVIFNHLWVQLFVLLYYKFLEGRDHGLLISILCISLSMCLSHTRNVFTKSLLHCILLELVLKSFKMRPPKKKWLWEPSPSRNLSSGNLCRQRLWNTNIFITLRTRYGTTPALSTDNLLDSLKGRGLMDYLFYFILMPVS